MKVGTRRHNDDPQMLHAQMELRHWWVDLQPDNPPLSLNIVKKPGHEDSPFDFYIGRIGMVAGAKAVLLRMKGNEVVGTLRVDEERYWEAVAGIEA